MIKINNLVKNYKVKKNVYHALKGVNLEFNDNEFVCILGPSGCGKTTLLNIIGGLDSDIEGDFFVDNVNTATFSSHDWDSYRNHYIGFVFQNFNLISYINILRNVEMSLVLSGDNKKHSRKLAKEALDKVGLKGLYNKMPNQLSGGQLQRVAIARAIVNNPKIILADEPTGALDSETSIEIMNLLKELSKEHLVITVTHNLDLANKYGDRIVKILDGKVIFDEKVNDIQNKISCKEYKKQNSFMSLFTALSLSLKNLINKYIRTILIIFASSIGIIGVTLVLAVSSGVSDYVDKVQIETLYTNPIRISSNYTMTTEGTIQSKLEQYTSEKIVIVTKTNTIIEGVNNIDEGFIDYIESIDNDRYSVINYNRSIMMNIYSKQDDKYYSISTNYLQELVNDKEFLEGQFDLIDGVYPTNANQIAIVVDSYNSIPYYVFQSVGLDFEKGVYATSDLIGKKYRIITNNNLYEKNEKGYYSKRLSSLAYEEDGNIELEICGVIRAKRTSNYDLYNGCLLYTSKLTDLIEQNCKESDIVKDQIEWGIEKDVLTGKPFADNESTAITLTVDYQYQMRLIEIGAIARVTAINIYSNNFEDRVYIKSYVESYERYSDINIKYYDYMSSISEDFAIFIDILTKVLIVFALIALLVSSIMITIITYISVLERTKEIGILRALGSRRIDITIVFCAETLIVGFCSGIIGILVSFGISDYINALIRTIINDNFNNMKGVDVTNFVTFDWKELLIILLGSMLITIFSGLIPSIRAAFKDPIAALKSE